MSEDTEVVVRGVKWRTLALAALGALWTINTGLVSLSYGERKELMSDISEVNIRLVAIESSRFDATRGNQLLQNQVKMQAQFVSQSQLIASMQEELAKRGDWISQVAIRLDRLERN